MKLFNFGRQNRITSSPHRPNAQLSLTVLEAREVPATLVYANDFEEFVNQVPHAGVWTAPVTPAVKTTPAGARN